MATRINKVTSMAILVLSMSIGERSLQFLFTPGKGGVYLNQEYTIPAPGMQINFTSRRKVSQNFNEKGKKALDGGGQAWYSSSTCEKGLFSAVRIRCPGDRPLTCGTQGGSSRSPPYPLGASLRPLALDFGLRQAGSGVFFSDSAPVK